MVSGGSEAGTRSPIKIFGNIFISFIGAGVLGLPYAFKEAGVLEGCIVLCFVGFLSFSWDIYNLYNFRYFTFSTFEVTPLGHCRY